MGLGSDSLIPSLAPLASIFDLVFVDQRGCGKSDPAKNGSYLFSDFASDLVEIVQETKTKGPVGIFGHSMGGMIAVETLARFPNLFQFAILSNTAIDASWRGDAGNDLSTYKTDVMARAVERYSELPEDADRLRDLAVAYGPLYFPELSEADAMAEMSKFSYRADAIDFMNKHCFPGMDLRREAASIHVPTLLISGTADLVVPPRCSLVAAEIIPQSAHAAIEGAGHFPFVTQPDRFFEQVSHWWEETRRKS
jgi:proline iminopeptidase